MLNLKKIAVTGNLSSGKSTVCEIFREMGAYVVDADLIVQDLLNYRKDIQDKVIELLGQDIVNDTILNRKKIADKVFKNPLLLSHLEKIIHPEVRTEITTQWKKVSKENQWTCFVAEIPLLFETEPNHPFDATIVVHANEAICYKRFNLKTQNSKKEFDLRMQRQMPSKLKSEKADFTLFNDGNLKNLKSSTQKIYSQIIH
ncbi:MAG: Dephospho-CoA kinase [Chlamydiae bacterium]|nr:Dephospho-CoA kinase [Chlamydiota bacterium]